jgi:hypothetical protein
VANKNSGAGHATLGGLRQGSASGPASFNAAIFGDPELMLRALMSPVVGADCGTYLNDWLYTDFEGTSGNSATETRDDGNGSGRVKEVIAAGQGYNFFPVYGGGIGIGTYPIAPLMFWNPWAVGWRGNVSAAPVGAEAALVGVFQSGVNWGVGGDGASVYTYVGINNQPGEGGSATNFVVKSINNGTGRVVSDTLVPFTPGIDQTLILFNDGAGTLYLVVDGAIAWSRDVQSAGVPPNAIIGRPFWASRNSGVGTFTVINDYVIAAGLR